MLVSLPRRVSHCRRVLEWTTILPLLVLEWWWWWLRTLLRPTRSSKRSLVRKK